MDRIWAHWRRLDLMRSNESIPNAVTFVCFLFVAVQDPHDELKGQNVLIIRGSDEETAAKFGLSMDVLRQLLETALSTMRESRQRRPRPHLDDKMLASWNGESLSNHIGKKNLGRRPIGGVCDANAPLFFFFVFFFLIFFFSNKNHRFDDLGLG